MSFRDLPAIRRSSLVLGLTIAAGCTDAISYLGLGRVFTANMTGNTVLLGVAVAQRDAGAAARSAAALGGFVLGAIAVGLAPEPGAPSGAAKPPAEMTAGGGVGAPAASEEGGGGAPSGAAKPSAASPRLIAGALVAELGLLAALLGWWVAAGSSPHGAVQDGLIALAGTAMGVQSAAVARLAVPGVATTYVTGTWTGISAGVARWLRRRPSDEPVDAQPQRGLQAAVVVVYLCGAIAGGFAHDGWGPPAAAIPLAVIAGVVTLAATHDG